MARVTVEDCVDKVENRFDLVLIAGRRARDMGEGAELLVSRDNDKFPVVALREISEEKMPLEEMRDNLIQSYQRVIESDESEEDLMELLEGESGEWPGDIEAEMKLAADQAQAAAEAAIPAAPISDEDDVEFADAMAAEAHDKEDAAEEKFNAAAEAEAEKESAEIDAVDAVDATEEDS